MTQQAMFTPNGDGYDVSPAGAFILCAATVYGGPAESTPEGISNARTFMDATLAAARAGGYKQGDVLQTLLARPRIDQRTMLMAQAAVDAAGAGRMAAVMRNAGMGEGGAQ